MVDRRTELCTFSLASTTVRLLLRPVCLGRSFSSEKIFHKKRILGNSASLWCSQHLEEQAHHEGIQEPTSLLPAVTTEHCPLLGSRILDPDTARMIPSCRNPQDYEHRDIQGGGEENHELKASWVLPSTPSEILQSSAKRGSPTNRPKAKQEETCQEYLDPTPKMRRRRPAQTQYQTPLLESPSCCHWWDRQHWFKWTIEGMDY